MASFSLMHWLVVAVVILVLFGRGKISQTMGDFGQGIRSFRKGMTDDDSPSEEKVMPIVRVTKTGPDGTVLPMDVSARTTNS